MKTKKMYVSVKNPPWYDTNYSYNTIRFRQGQYFDTVTNHNLVDFWQVGASADENGDMWIRFRIEVKV